MFQLFPSDNFTVIEHKAIRTAVYLKMQDRKKIIRSLPSSRCGLSRQ
ncbi:hypothetical protein [Mucilaginibacter kameinonensis]|nr:hypothetical protein [Mucilaginibacter kameinonensis]